MLTQYTAGALLCENRILCHPAATGSIPAAADQEDFVSMGMTTAIKTRQIMDNAYHVLSIEYLAAAQAFDFRAPARPGPATQAAYDVIRRHVEFLDDDRPLFNDINQLAKVVRSGEILNTVEERIGALDMSNLAVTSERYVF
jgi:histidine ammonia-lyase